MPCKSERNEKRQYRHDETGGSYPPHDASPTIGAAPRPLASLCAVSVLCMSTAPPQLGCIQGRIIHDVSLMSSHYDPAIDRQWHNTEPPGRPAGGTPYRPGWMTVARQIGGVGRCVSSIWAAAAPIYATTRLRAMWCVSFRTLSGGGGIRTHGKFPYTRFPSVPVRPLSHSSLVVGPEGSATEVVTLS